MGIVILNERNFRERTMDERNGSFREMEKWSLKKTSEKNEQ